MLGCSSCACASVPVDEERAAAQIAEMIGARVEKDRQAAGSAHRDAHAKAHGCVRAVLKVDDRLPPAFSQGVFQPGRVYPSWIRFSNGSGQAAADSAGDARGMAIKLMGVPGPKLAEDERSTQDFLFLNHPVFFVRDAADYVEFVRAASAGHAWRFFFPSLNPARWRLHELNIGRAIRGRKAADLLALRYWSTTPYLMGGSGPAKFSVRPCGPAAPDRPAGGSPDFLREALAVRLSSRPACFEFLVQLQKDASAMPVEDPTILWSESASPFVRVGTVEIPAPQRFESAAQVRFCENLSFSPWHSVPEHRPLGGINRVRRVVYESVSRLRHALNREPRAEPSDASGGPISAP